MAIFLKTTCKDPYQTTSIMESKKFFSWVRSSKVFGGYVMLVGRGTNTKPRWWFQIFSIFTPKIGEMIQFEFVIFFNWLGSSNRLDSHLGSDKGSGRKHKGWEPGNPTVELLERQDMEARLAAFEKRS